MKKTPLEKQTDQEWRELTFLREADELGPLRDVPFVETDEKRRLLKTLGVITVMTPDGKKYPINDCSSQALGHGFENVYHSLIEKHKGYKPQPSSKF